jgi:hypothetical protein
MPMLSLSTAISHWAFAEKSCWTKALSCVACLGNALLTCAGMVRIWRIGKQAQDMEASMKDHKGPVNAIVVKHSR